MKNFKTAVSKALIIFLIMSVLCGIIYPLLITGISQIVFKDKANGSIIEVDGVKYGSSLLGQQFSGGEYLWGRIMLTDTESFTDETGKKSVYGWASNLTPAGEELEKLVAKRVEKIKQSNPDAGEDKIPVDLVTCSGSGLDPHISTDAAEYQIPRIARERGMDEKDVAKIIDQYTTGRFLGIFGEKVVNVLEVNLALDGILK